MFTVFFIALFTTIHLFYESILIVIKGVFKGGGEFRGFKPPPSKFPDFFLKSEGKEIERKRRKKGCWGGGGVTS